MSLMCTVVVRCEDIITNKQHTLVIIQNASAPRDTGQTVRLHKLTGHPPQKYSFKGRKQHAEVKLNASTPTQTVPSTRQHTGELFISVVSTCATHRSDGNAPQTPLSQSDILNERTPLRLNFEKKDLLFFGENTTLKSADKFEEHLPPPGTGTRRLVVPFSSNCSHFSERFRSAVFSPVAPR